MTFDQYRTVFFVTRVKAVQIILKFVQNCHTLNCCASEIVVQ